MLKTLCIWIQIRTRMKLEVTHYFTFVFLILQMFCERTATRRPLTDEPMTLCLVWSHGAETTNIVFVCLWFSSGGKWPRQCSAWCWYLPCAGCRFTSVVYSRRRSMTRMTPTAVNCSGIHPCMLTQHIYLHSQKETDKRSYCSPGCDFLMYRRQPSGPPASC